jgi:hypothetical protein
VENGEPGCLDGVRGESGGEPAARKAREAGCVAPAWERPEEQARNAEAERGEEDEERGAEEKLRRGPAP